jgi:hypothetical protein
VEQIVKAFRVALFDRRTAASISFDTAATGDAVLIVAGVHAVIQIVGFVRAGSFNVFGLLQAVVLGVAGWIFLSFAVWLMGTRLLKGSGEAQTLIRLTGFAHLPLLLTALGSEVQTVPNSRADAIGLVGLVWYLSAVVIATSVALGLRLKESLASVVLGAALIFLFQLLLRVPFLFF